MAEQFSGYGAVPIDFSGIGNIADTYTKARLGAQRERVLSDLGKGTIDYGKASQALLAAGDTEGGLSLARLAESKSARAETQGLHREEFGFRQEESRRAQSNADRQFNESTRQFNESLKQREERTIPEQVSAREQAAKSRGLDPTDPRLRDYILTGKMPREDQQPLTATDKKAILEADEHVQTNIGAIDSLKRAQELSSKAYGGPLAGQRGYATSIFGDEAGKATTELTTEITQNSVSQLKAIFGGNPTEGERKILLDIQGSVNQPDAVRQDIYKRAAVLAERRLEFNKQRADALRGGTFYKPGSGPGNPAPTTTAPGALPQFKSPDEVARMVQTGKLKKGDSFLDAAGNTRIVP